MSDQDHQSQSDELLLLAALPGLVRLGASAWWRATEWTLGNGVRASQRIIRAAASGESPALLMSEAGNELREYIRALLDIVDSPPEGPSYETSEAAAQRATANGAAVDRDSIEALRERGAELLRRSADVRWSEEAHPAYANILGNLAPDEGRILRLLVLEGPQASIDVRTAPPLGIGSTMVAPGMNMIGREAGCREVDRLHAYLANLYRLGLIWFSRESLEDQNRYHVLEAQPEVQVAMSEAGRTRTVRRSIHLTDFGRDFCATCLPLDTAELDALPRDGV
jgi:cytosine/adenosine deaminase-related metal-dependent hydrolase